MEVPFCALPVRVQLQAGKAEELGLMLTEWELTEAAAGTKTGASSPTTMAAVSSIAVCTVLVFLMATMRMSIRIRVLLETGCQPVLSGYRSSLPELLGRSHE